MYDDAICYDVLGCIPGQLLRVVVIEDDIPATPLAMLLTLMRQKWVEGDRDGAAEIARAAAPYMHHRLATIAGQAGKLIEVHLLTDAELTERLELLTERERVTTGDPDISL